jgi:hypothetical protein
VYSQKTIVADSSDGAVWVKAGAAYQKSSFYQWLMGSNYRKEWTTPVKVPVFLLDTAKGGLKPYKEGGGHQTKSLHVKTAAEKEYALRSVNKSLGKVLPEILHHTFAEEMVNDEVSMSNPYGAVSVPLMAEKAKIYHTNPSYVYLPNQASLDTFNNDYGHTLYLFEQRLSGSWKEADNLGNFTNFIDTYELLDSLHNNNQYSVDQRLFVRSRLFDMFIGDWDRHEDQWAWGLLENGDKKIYQPVPQDRDQAFFKYNGVLLKLLIKAAGLKYFQAFDYTLPDVKTFNYEERNLDRTFANETTLEDWQATAKELQQLLTDGVIEASVKQLPPEAFEISGNNLIAKLKSRREHLGEYATDYYLFIAKEVEITGSKGNEYFEVTRVNDNETSVKVYRMNQLQKDGIPYYSRLFRNNETNEVRLYGLAGNDFYSVSGKVDKAINIRIIGGAGKDSIVDHSSVKSDGKKTFIYDDFNNSIVKSNATKLNLSNDTGIHSFRYFSYLYDKKGISPTIFFNLEDRLFVGLNAQLIHHKWRESLFDYKQRIAVNYSISQHAPSVTYEALFPKKIGKWDLLLKANYDAIRWTKFFGLGNETPFLTDNNDFYRMRSREWWASIGINRVINHNDITISSYFQSVKVLDDRDRFVSKVFAPLYPANLSTNNFAGAKLRYIFDKVNDSIVPTKGISFSGSIAYSHNLSQAYKDFSKYYGCLQFYVPIANNLSLSVKTAASTVVGNPQFYQHVSIGGPETLRGYRLDRFWGKTAFYDANELRYITDIRSYIYNGKAGLVALWDNGRVWMPSEKSDVWHTAYGAGVLLAPFNKILIEVTYGISKEMKLFQLRVGRSF